MGCGVVIVQDPEVKQIQKHKPTKNVESEVMELRQSIAQSEIIYSNQCSCRDQHLYPVSKDDFKNSIMHQCIGALLFKHPKNHKIYKGTACLIAPDLILTCAHNIYNHQQRLHYKEFKFYLAANGKLQNPCLISQYQYHEQFTKKGNSLEYDYAVMKLSRAVKRDKFPELGICFDRFDEKVSVFGYPGEKYKILDQQGKNFQAYQYGLTQEKRIITDHVNKNTKRICYEISTLPGQSGSPIIVEDDKIIGIHKAGIPIKKCNAGRFITVDLILNIQIWRQRMGADKFTIVNMETKMHQIIGDNLVRELKLLYSNEIVQKQIEELRQQELICREENKKIKKEIELLRASEARIIQEKKEYKDKYQQIESKLQNHILSSTTEKVSKNTVASKSYDYKQKIRIDGLQMELKFAKERQAKYKENEQYLLNQLQKISNQQFFEEKSKINQKNKIEQNELVLELKELKEEKKILHKKNNELVQQNNTLSRIKVHKTSLLDELKERLTSSENFKTYLMAQIEKLNLQLMQKNKIITKYESHFKIDDLDFIGQEIILQSNLYVKQQKPLGISIISKKNTKSLAAIPQQQQILPDLLEKSFIKKTPKKNNDFNYQKIKEFNNWMHLKFIDFKPANLSAKWDIDNIYDESYVIQGRLISRKSKGDRMIMLRSKSTIANPLIMSYTVKRNTGKICFGVISADATNPLYYESNIKQSISYWTGFRDGWISVQGTRTKYSHEELKVDQHQKLSMLINTKENVVTFVHHQISTKIQIKLSKNLQGKQLRLFVLLCQSGSQLNFQSFQLI